MKARHALAWLPERERAIGLEIAETITYTTVRGAFRMAPIEDFSRLPTVAAFLEGGEPYGCYLLRYGVGADKPPHVDDGAPHERVVCVLQNAVLGGEIILDGSVERLSARDALIFRADLVAHAVANVLAGERIVITAGRRLS